jgi:hypothetical protein
MTFSLIVNKNATLSIIAEHCHAECIISDTFAWCHIKSPYAEYRYAESRGA